MAIRKIVARSIGVDVIVAEDLADNSITAAEITNGAVTADKLASNSVTTAKITDANVTTGKLATDLVVTHALGSASTPSITFTGDTNTGIFSPTADTIAFAEGGAEVMRINSSGNVGIGTNSPSYALDVRSASVPTLRLSRSGSAGQIVSVLFEDGNATLGTANTSRIASDSGAISFSTGGTSGADTGGTERMRIDSSGNVLVGTTSNFGLITTNIGANQFTAATAAASFAASLTHTTTDNSGRPAITVASKGTGQDTCFRTVVSSNDGSTFNGWAVGVNIEVGSDALSWMYNSGQSTRIFAGGAVKMRLTTGGGLSTSTGSLGTISDIRMKKNVVDATSKLDELMQLRVVNYVLIDDPEERKMLGFVAQEIEQVFPGLVEEFDVRDQETKELIMMQKSVKTTVLIPMLVKAIQELKAENDTLKQRLDAAGL